MGLLSRVFGSRPDESSVTHAVGDAVTQLPGVSGHSLTYQHQQYGGGALHGVVDVDDSPTFLTVLRTAVSTLADLLGDDVDRVTFYLSGRTPDGEPVVPGDLGTSQPPLGRELRTRLAP
ncbi:hypothetical protein [Nocardioides lijunqiniae]|uniref:hypothetical protein n=1 Tax=Nocardioides lijunqiniae TaxID=2760832 RepID=UPI001877B64C|nr:hypothetical protein [Nocardioides lijunqiniae]